MKGKSKWFNYICNRYLILSMNQDNQFLSYIELNDLKKEMKNLFKVISREIIEYKKDNSSWEENRYKTKIDDLNTLE